MLCNARRTQCTYRKEKGFAPVLLAVAAVCAAASCEHYMVLFKRIRSHKNNSPKLTGTPFGFIRCYIKAEVRFQEEVNLFQNSSFFSYHQVSGPSHNGSKYLGSLIETHIGSLSRTGEHKYGTLKDSGHYC